MTTPLFRLIVSAGTYHLPFDRLIEWIEPWYRRNPDAFVVIQHGVGPPLPGATNYEMIPQNILLDLYAESSAVVLQGGAGGVMDARLVGLRPIIVPRRPENGEVVDNHQILFARRLNELGIVFIAETRSDLHRLLDQALAGNLSTRSEVSAPTQGANNAMATLSNLPSKLGRRAICTRIGRSSTGLARRLLR